MRPAFACLTLALAACGSTEHYGFVAQLGRDTVSVERVARQGNALVIDGVDQFPRVRPRHSEVELGDDGTLRRLDMTITTPSEPPAQRDRFVSIVVERDSVRLTKRDSGSTKRIAFPVGSRATMAHVSQMYSLYD